MKLSSILVFIFLSFSTFAKEEWALFIHGGPGFHSKAEEQIFTQLKRNPDLKIFFWNEPSALRNIKITNAITFQDALHDIQAELVTLYFAKKQKINIISHSFGAQYALKIAQSKYAKMVKKFIFLNSALDLHSGDKRVLKLALNDLYQSNKAVSQQISGLLPKIEQDQFGPNKKQAFQLALADQNLFANYWSDFKEMANYFSFYTGAYQFDVNNFFKIRETASYQIPAIIIRKKTLFIYGDQDPVIDQVAEQKIAAKIFKNRKVIKMQGKHYLHITKGQEVLQKIAEFVGL